MSERAGGEPERTIPRSVALAAGLGGLIGALAAVGWLAGARELHEPFSSGGDMKLNSALCLLALAGSELALVTGRSARSRALASGLAALALAVALLTLAEHLFGWRLGIDQLLVHDVQRPALRHPGRMGPLAAAVIAVLALAILVRRRAALMEALAVASAATGPLVLFAYAFAIVHPRFGEATPIPVQSAVALLALAIGAVRLAAHRLLPLFTGTDPVHVAGRRMLLVAAITLPLLERLRIDGAEAGLYSADVGTALLAGGLLLIFGGLVVWTVMTAEAATRRTAHDRAHLAGVLAAATESSIIATDLGGLITTFNPGAERLLGYAARDVVGLLTPAAFHDPEEVAARAAELGIAAGYEVLVRAARSGIAETRDWTYIRADGKRIPVSLTVTAMRAEHREVGYIGIARDVSAERRVAAERQRGAARMRTVFTGSPVPTLITRMSDGIVLLANPACLEVLGWQEDELVGRAIEDAGFWAAPGRRDFMLAQLRAEGSVRELEEEITTGTGERRIVLNSISQVELDGEQCLVSHIDDITERRALEAQLRETEARFREVTETIQQGFVLSELDPPRVLYASPSVERLFGIDHDTLYRDPLALQALVHRDDRERFVAQRAGMTGPTDFEFRTVRPDGETRWIRSRAEFVDHGRDARVATVSEDITEERELREALRESEERFRLLAENSTDVIGRLSLDMRITYISPACRVVYGYEPEAMLGRFGWEFVHGDDLAELRDDFTARPDHSDVVTNTYRVRRGDGSHIWVEAKIRTLRDPVSGEAVEFHTVARDITERKRAEAEVGRAREKAEEANNAKSEFLSRMSHELRTPLHAVLGFGELLAREDLRAEQRDTVKRITTAGRHLLELINEVLDLSRIDRGEIRLSPEPVHAGDVVRETLEMVAPLAAARSIVIVAPASHDAHAHVIADRQRLKQVLLNLLSNAVKYNREGGELRVRTRSSSGESSRTRIEVSDTGVGIATEDLPRLFAAFDRLGAEATSVEGTGLGLALAQRLVEAMGGEIGVRSEVGTGTTFWVELPATAAPESPPAPAGAEPLVRAALPRGLARSVLYIEDNPSNIKLVETIVAARPEVSLLVATQGSLGLELAREHHPALILLDLNLPDGSGEEVLHRIRGDRRTADIPVAIVSADATSGQAARLRRAGADHYLSKPFEIDEFLAIIDGSSSPEGDEPVAADPAPAATDGPLNLECMRQLRNLYPDGGALREVVGLFRDDSPARIATLSAVSRSGDAAGVWQAAHAWKGACALLGAQELVARLAAIEIRALEGRVPDERDVADVEETYRVAEAALARELE